MAIHIEGEEILGQEFAMNFWPLAFQGTRVHNIACEWSCPELVRLAKGRKPITSSDGEGTMNSGAQRTPIIPSIQKGVRKVWRPIEDGTREWWRQYRRFIKEPPVPGEAVLTPSRVRAGRQEYLRLTFRVGDGGLDAYGHIAVECPLAGLQILKPGITFRAHIAYVSVSCSNPRPELDLTLSDSILDLLIRGFPLKKGDEVTFLIGDPRGNPARMPLQAQRYPFPIAVDAHNMGIYQRIAEFPVLEVVGDVAQQLDIIAPAVVELGEPFDLYVRAVDGMNANPDPSYAGCVRLICTDPVAELPSMGEMSDVEHVIRGIRLQTPGVHRITAIDEGNGLIGVSNPIATSDFYSEGYRVFFGDIHGHNWNCDGRGSTDEYYRWARDVRRLDFAALTNHVEGAKRFDVSDFWPEVIAKAKEYYTPERFVTFLAFEWGSWERFGDKCVYYLDDDGPYFAANDERTDTPAKLWAALRGRVAITIPHHSKYGGQTDWHYHDEELQPVVEIYSMWGNSESGSACSVQSAWARGYRLGVIAGSDTHLGQPGNPHCGLAAILAKRLTREALFTALKVRRCYATTGSRILLDFRVNGVPMGGVVQKEADCREVKVEVKVAGTAPLEKVEVVRDNQVVYTHFPDSWSTKFIWRDSSTLSTLQTFYYLRVSQVDGEMAWSSPVWIKG